MTPTNISERDDFSGISSYKILLVEDDEGLGHLMRKILKRSGFEVDLFTTGHKILKAYERQENELLIVDYHLPDMNGKEIMLQLQKRTGTSPDFITLTGVGNEKIAVEMMKLGSRDYIVKEPGLTSLLPSVVLRVIRSIENEKQLHKTQNELNKHLELLKLTGELTRLGGWEIDLQSNSVHWSEQMKKIHEVPEKYSPSLEEAIAFYAEDSKEEIEHALDEAIHTGKEYDLELPLITAQGRKIWVHTIGKPQMKNGKCIRIYGTSQDITERKEAEEKLRKTNQQLRKSETQLKDSNHQLRKEEKANKQLTFKLTERLKELNCLYSIALIIEKPGISLDQILQQSVQTIPPAWQYPDKTSARIVLKGKEYTTATFQESDIKISQGLHINGDKSGHIEVFLQNDSRQDKTLSFLEEEKRLLFLIAERLGKVISRISLNEKLAQKTKLLHETERSGKIGGWELDPDTLEQTWTEEMFRILEMDTTKRAPELPNILTFIDQRFRGDAKKSIQDAIEAGKPFNKEWLVATAKGNKKWLNAVLNPELEKGKVKVIKGSFQDITARKKAEENLEASNQQLRASNQQLTALNQQLAANEQQLQSANHQLTASEQQLKALNQQLVANEQELIKNKEKAESYLNVAAEIILSLDKEGNITMLNESGHQLLGYKNGALIGKNWFIDCLPQQNVNELRGVFNQLMNGELKNVTNYESDLITKSGNLRTILWHNTILKNEKGNISGTLSSGEDITQQKAAYKDTQKAKEAAEISEERFRKSQEAGHVGSWEYNLKTGVSWGSDEAKRIINLDLDKKEFPAEEVIKLVSEKDKDKVKQAMVDLVSNNKPYDIEYEITPVNTSEKKIVRSIAELQKDKDGNPTKVTGIIRDITKQKLAEQKIKESESFLKAIYKNSLNAILVADDEGNYISVNDAAADFLGFSKEQLLESNVGNLQTVEENDAANKYKIYTEKGEETGEFEFIRPDGIKKTALYSAIRVKEDFNLSILADITERKQVELELIKAKEKAEEADQLKSAFLANMSHEIRTPMNGILGFTDLLKKPDISGENQLKYIDIIQKSGIRMLETVNALIDISKIETGQVTVSKEKIDINQEVQSLFDFFSAEAKRKGLAFVLENKFPKEMATICTDKRKLSSIISNLIKNAIKYTDKGFVKVGLELRKDNLYFYVKDSGIGIPKDRQKAIFNRFEQADIQDTRAFQGSGLGLAIVKAYIKMMGGQIGVESEEGIGSAFFISLPVERETQANTNHPEEKTKLITDIKDLKILIAEDDIASAQYVTVITKKLAKQLLYAKTGKETIALCKKHPDIDLVLMDIKMPEINGYEATQEIRKFNSEVVIIAQTAHALTGDREKALAAGCDEYITKPIEMEKLLKLISQVLKSKKAT